MGCSLLRYLDWARDPFLCLWPWTIMIWTGSYSLARVVSVNNLISLHLAGPNNREYKKNVFLEERLLPMTQLWKEILGDFGLYQYWIDRFLLKFEAYISSISSTCMQFRIFSHSWRDAIDILMGRVVLNKKWNVSGCVPSYLPGQVTWRIKWRPRPQISDISWPPRWTVNPPFWKVRSSASMGMLPDKTLFLMSRLTGWTGLTVFRLPRRC